LIFVNHSTEFKNLNHFIQLKRDYLNFCTNLPTVFLIKYLSTSLNKGHR